MNLDPPKVAIVEIRCLVDYSTSERIFFLDHHWQLLPMQTYILGRRSTLLNQRHNSILSIMQLNLICYEYLIFAAGLVYDEFRIEYVLKSLMDKYGKYLIDSIFCALFSHITSICHFGKTLLLIYPPLEHQQMTETRGDISR